MRKENNYASICNTRPEFLGQVGYRINHRPQYDPLKKQAEKGNQMTLFYIKKIG